MYLYTYPTRASEDIPVLGKLAVKAFSEGIHSCFMNALNELGDYRASANSCIPCQ